MQLTSKEINSLSSSLKTTLNLDTVSWLIKPIITDPNTAELLERAIGSKGANTIKNSQALELTKKMLGQNDINAAIAEAKTKESLSKQNIILGLKNIIDTLSNQDNSSQYFTILEKAKSNLLILSQSEEFKFLEGDDLAGEDQDVFNLILKSFSTNIKSIHIDSFSEDHENELLYILSFNDNTELEIDMEFYTNSDYSIDINSHKSSINGISFELLSYEITQLMIYIIHDNFYKSVHPQKELISISEETLKKLSIIISNTNCL